jgi:hypothetical protein
MAAMAALAILDQHLHTDLHTKKRSCSEKISFALAVALSSVVNVQMRQHEMVTWPHAPHCFVPPLPHPMLAHVFANTSSATPFIVAIVDLVA